MSADLHHADAAAVGANPGRTVADPPDILLKTFITYLETAETVPAEGQDFPTAVTLELFFPPAPGIRSLFIASHNLPSCGSDEYFMVQLTADWIFCHPDLPVIR